MLIEFQPRRILYFLLCGVFLLTLAHVAITWWWYLTGHRPFSVLVRLFHLDLENNLPTWYATALHAAAAIGLFAISCREKARKIPVWKSWRVLSLIFLVLSVDEAASIHEVFMMPLKKRFVLDGPLYFAWVAVYIPLVGALALYLLRWFFSLPSWLRWQSAFAATLFVGGAAGMEMAAGHIVSGPENVELQRYLKEMPSGVLATPSDDSSGRRYLAVMTLEELLEMLGLVVWLYALARYAKETGTWVEIRPTA